MICPDRSDRDPCDRLPDLLWVNVALSVRIPMPWKMTGPLDEEDCKAVDLIIDRLFPDMGEAKLSDVDYREGTVIWELSVEAAADDRGNVSDDAIGEALSYEIPRESWEALRVLGFEVERL